MLCFQTSQRPSFSWLVVFLLAAAAPLRPDEVQRGDTNHDHIINITDAIRLLNWLSLGGVREICVNAADANDDGRVDISDAVYILNFMFVGGPEPRPFPADIERSCVGPQGALALQGLEAMALSPTSAVVQWDTSEPSDTLLRHGRDGSLSEAPVVLPELALRHQALLTGLAPGTTYRFEAVSTNGGAAASGTGTFTTLPDASYSVREGHPRIFFTEEDLPDIRRRVQEGEYYPERWRRLLLFCERNLVTPPYEVLLEENFPLFVRAFAFAGLVGRDERFQEKAASLALALAGDRLLYSIRDGTEAMAYVYDWLHGQLPGETRRVLEAALVENCRLMDEGSRENEFVLGAHTIRLQRPLILGSLAVYHEAPGAPAVAENVRRRMHYGFLATHRYFASADGGSSEGWNYLNYNFQFVLGFLAAWRSATGQNWYESERPWLEKELQWYLYGLREDLNFFQLGDSRIYDGLIHEHRLFALALVKELANPQAQWYAELARESGESWAPHAVADILWSEPSLPAEPPSWPTSRLFKNAGVAICRESWSPEAAMASFRCEGMYTLGHTHRDNCSFTVYYRGDLALDSGLYEEFGGGHHRNYYTRTIAHNTITVHDPEEVFSLYDAAYANDGGQQWFSRELDGERSWWPPTIEHGLTPKNGFLAGGIVRFERRDGYTYMLGDGTPSYSGYKVHKFHRHFLWLESATGWPHPVILVFDDVTSGRRDWKKTYHLHSRNEPAIDGRLAAMENGEGKLYQWTLLPAEATLAAVGGPGQEFLVNGVNYPPDRGARGKEEPGGWRLEVSPARQNRFDLFLHALYLADREATPPPRPGIFTAGTMQGCQIGEWVVLFDYGEPLDGVAYLSNQQETSHVLFGMVPNAAYELNLDGSFLRKVYSSAQGTVRFRLEAAGTVELRRVPY